jgi:hypothetical protein
MGAAASNDTRSEYVKYIHDGGRSPASGGRSPADDRRVGLEAKRELKDHFLRARASGMDGEQLFEHMARLTEERLEKPGMALAGRRKFNYPGHVLLNGAHTVASEPALDSRAASREVPSRHSLDSAPMGGYGANLVWPENGDSRLGANLVQVDSLRLRNRHRPLRRAARSEMIKLQENKLSII